MLEASANTLGKMRSKAGASLERPVKAIVYASKGDMDVALPFRSETTSREVRWAGMAFPDMDVVVLLGSSTGLRDVTAHELTHLLTAQLTSNPFTSIPAWLNEGLSMYAENEPSPSFRAALNAAAKSSKLISVRAASSMPGKPEDIGAFYGEAQSLVRYLVDTHGSEKMSQLLGAFKRGASTDVALTQVYGFDADGLDARWRATIGAPALGAPVREDSGQPVPRQPAAVSPVGQPESDERAALYVVLAASAVFVSMAFLSGILLVRRR